MENKELEWIGEIADKLQVPMTYNERQRLTKILVEVAPYLIKTRDEVMYTGFSTYYTDDDGNDTLVKAGHSCNGCGQDHYFREGNPKHWDIGVKRDGSGGEQCIVEILLQILEDAENKKDK